MTKSSDQNPASHHPKQDKTSWGKVAGWYDDLLENTEDTYQEKVIMPNLLRIVEPNPGQKILDIACGQGYFSRAFHKNGAQVTACDISPELVALAAKNSPKEILFFVASAEKIVESAAGKIAPGFDTATIVLAIQNIEDMRATFKEAASLLKTGGRLILVTNHPAFRIPKSSSWEWDAKANKQYRRVDSYMSDSKTKIDMAPGTSAKNKSQTATTLSFHRPIQSYFKALNSAGLAVTRLEEWISHKQSQTGPRAVEEDRIRKEIPIFMCIEARKL